MAVQDYELLLRVRADLLEAITGLKGLTSELGQGDVAAKKLGESADAASARIHAMVQASVAQQKAMEGSIASTARAVEESKRIVQSADEEAAAYTRTRAAAQAFRDAEAARGGKASATAARTVELAAQRDEMAKLAGQIDPTITALGKLDAQERSLNAMRKAGVVGMEDYTRFKAVIDANRLSINGAAKSMHTFSFNTAQTRMEMGRLIKDISTGQWGRLASTGTTLANQAGFISLLFSPLGLAIAAVTGTIGLFAVAAIKGAADTDMFNKSIQQTGNFAGVTAAELGKMATDITGVNGSVADSRTVLAKLVTSGKVGSASLEALGRAAVNMADLTGISAEKAADAVLKMFDGTAAGAAKADEQYHFLTTSIYDQIKALEDQGDTEQAINVEAEAWNAAAVERQHRLQMELSATASWWDKIKGKALGAWEAMKNDGDIALALGLANDQQKIADLQKRKLAAAPNQYGHTGSAAGVFNNIIGLGFGPKEQAQLDALQAKVAKAKQDAIDTGTQQGLNSGAVQADAALDGLAKSIDKAYAKKEKIKELNKYFNQLWAGADPGNAKLNGVQRFVAADGSSSFGGGLYDQLLAGIEKAPKVAKARAARTPNDTAAIAAQRELIKLLGDEQGALDPVAKAWATYNDEVAKANALAAKAVTAKGADVVAINAQRDALVKLYATQREAQIAAQAQKTSDMIDKAIKPLPTYKGLDALVGGPFGEVAKADQARQALDEGYAKDLQKLNEFHDRKLLSDQQFVERENALFKEHAVETGRIDQARSQAMLLGITQSFAAGADAIKQGFGAQSDAYRAAFALSKSAALAQAAVDMYSSISKASAWGWPENIPLIAQAVGQGLSIIGQLNSLSAGYRDGGYTGSGPADKPAGTVHAGEVVWSQKDIARAGGVSMVEAMRLGMAGYADGGIVGAFAPAADFPQGPATRMPSTPTGNTGKTQTPISLRVVNNVDPAMIHDAMSSSEGERVILNTISRNRSTIKQTIR
jgi:phage-related minor tail protein